jgi:ABC-2 type transport system permease protein
MTGALLYLTVCSIRNSIRIRLRRLRQPRYLLIGLGLATYVVSILFSRPPQGFISIPEDYRQLAGIATAVLFTLTLGSAWVLPNTVALAFTSAEVQFSFPPR